MQDTGANEYDFSFWGRAGRTYFIQTSTDLIHWQDVEVEWGGDAVIGYGFYSTAPRFFLRLKHIEGQSGDVDGDGLSDADEIAAGTDAFNEDSDGDGWRDGLEVAIGTDPLDAASKPGAPPGSGGGGGGGGGGGALAEAGNAVELVYQPKVVYETWNNQSGALNWMDLVDGYDGSIYSGSGPQWQGTMNGLSYPPGDEPHTMPWLLEDWVEELAAASQTSHPGGSGDAWVMRSRVALHSARAVLAPLHRSFMVVHELTDEEDGTVVHQRAGWQPFTITPGYGAGQFSGMAEFTVPMTPGKVSRLKLTPAYFQAYQEAYGFDDTVWPPVQSVPVRDVTQNYLRRVSLRVAPGLEEQFGIEVSNTTVATIVVERTAELITVVITGENPGTAYLTARWLPDNEIVTVMEIDVLRKEQRTLSILEVTASSTGIPPHNMPTEQAVRDFMSDTWGVQANVKFTVNRDDCGSQPYDLSGEGYLDIHAAGTAELTEEERWLRNFSLARGGQGYKIVAVRQFIRPTDDKNFGDTLGYAVGDGIAFMHTYTPASKLHTMAHEVGHLLMWLSSSDHNDSSRLNVMNAVNHEPPQPEIRKRDWKRIR